MKLIVKNKATCLFLVTLALSCKEGTDTTTECKDDIICTAEFATVIIKLADNQGTAVELDSFYTVNKVLQKTYRYDKYYYELYNGYYPVVTDAEIKDLNKSGTSLEFVGYKNDSIVRKQFVIGQNCCHIIKISGPDSITINTPVKY